MGILSERCYGFTSDAPASDCSNWRKRDNSKPFYFNCFQMLYIQYMTTDNELIKNSAKFGYLKWPLAAILWQQMHIFNIVSHIWNISLVVTPGFDNQDPLQRKWYFIAYWNLKNYYQIVSLSSYQIGFLFDMYIDMGERIFWKQMGLFW